MAEVSHFTQTERAEGTQQQQQAATNERLSFLGVIKPNDSNSNQPSVSEEEWNANQSLKDKKLAINQMSRGQNSNENGDHTPNLELYDSHQNRQRT